MQEIIKVGKEHLKGTLGSTPNTAWAKWNSYPRSILIHVNRWKMTKKKRAIKAIWLNLSKRILTENRSGFSVIIEVM